MTCTASQAALAGKRPEGKMVEPHTVLEIADGVLDLGVAAMVGFQRQGVSRPVGDEGVIAVIGKEGQLRAGSGFHPADDEPHRGMASGSLLKGVYSVSATSAAPSIQ